MELIAPFLALFKGLLTTEQQASLFLITAGTSIGLEFFKNIYFSIWPERSRLLKRAKIHLAALSFGIMGGGVNYVIIEPNNPLWFSLLIGGLCGGASIILYKIFVFFAKKKGK